MGLNHEAAPVQVREHFAVEADEQGVRAREIIALSTIAESVVISTCNRMDVYVAAEQADRAPRSTNRPPSCTMRKHNA